MKANRKSDDRHLTQVRHLRAKLVGAIVLVLAVGARGAIAQQPAGQIAYTVGSLDLSEVRLGSANGTYRVLSPQIQVRVPPEFGVPGDTVIASVASLGMPVWSKDRRLIVANALLAPTSSRDLDSLLMNGLSTPSKILVVFDPSTSQGNAVFDMTTQGVLSPYAIDAAFSPDRNRLFYASLQTNFIQYGIINRDGTGNLPLFWTNLTEQAVGIGLDWSPRTDQLGNFGNLLVVPYPLPDTSCLGTPRTATGLLLVNLGPTPTYQILTHPQYCDWDFSSLNDRSPVFSPDGTQVAFVRAVQNSRSIVTGSAIMAINRGGPYGSERVVGYWPGMMITHLSWSPDSGQPGVVSRVMFDVTEVGFYGQTSPRGVWTLTVPVNGSGAWSPVSALGQQASAPAWGPAQ